jgi:hypothetical protein
MATQFNSIVNDDELYVEAAGMVGFEHLQTLVDPSGILGLPEDELRDDLRDMGYLDEWNQACHEAAVLYGVPSSYTEIEESGRFRNQRFLSLVAADMRVQPNLQLV